MEEKSRGEEGRRGGEEVRDDGGSRLGDKKKGIDGRKGN